MGRSVSYPSGALVAFSLLDAEDDDQEFAYTCLLEDLRERAGRAFPSLANYAGRRGREDRILMRNAFADFGVSTYGGIVAVWIVERQDAAHWEADWRNSGSPRAVCWLAQIAARFDALFGEYDCLDHMLNGEGLYRRREGAQFTHCSNEQFIARRTI